MDKIIAVIPVHNEALTITSVVLTARAYLPVIVIDDASEDGSGQRAAAAGASVLTLPRHYGKGEALQHGFAEALRRGVNAVVTSGWRWTTRPARHPTFPCREPVLA